MHKIVKQDTRDLEMFSFTGKIKHKCSGCISNKGEVWTYPRDKQWYYLFISDELKKWYRVYDPKIKSSVKKIDYCPFCGILLDKMSLVNDYIIVEKKDNHMPTSTDTDADVPLP